MRWLITGGCGFIGSNLIKYLMSLDNCHVRIIDNLSIGSKSILDNICDVIEKDGDSLPDDSQVDGQNRAEFLKADILDHDLLCKAMVGIDHAVHLAAVAGIELSVKNPLENFNINALGTLNVLEAARLNKIKSLVIASSGASIGEASPPIHEEIVPHPISPYGASKLTAECYGSCYYHTYGLNTVSLRFSNVYGPRSNNKNSVVAKFIRNAISNSKLTIYGNGRQTRDFIFVDDLAKAIYLAGTTENIGGEVMQISTQEETPINRLIEIMQKIFAKYSITLAVEYSDPRQGDVLRNFADASKAKKLMGWQYETTLEEGLARTIKWFTRKE